ncbi:spore coat polysaccharide biosynthesis protein spsg/glycosyltransferase, putative [Heliomicrobium modesticaldum Ice1]|uniref:Spore coat polysaccharide biosynthesis protein spsg/glycosyltransferase, putative n=1 Tax=Heliobacterium modesticaldum (strain ATCC 51547 / Ice1) TaxID=498761 RepID=B0TGZ2_HELMI|nr:spore coat polysaccharide biosynthesis protein spsg/glycosyltransferase [Heliomicrobium modesticaldum]ABZ83317.1 spore coat polysaccharide biosynthesis protein spsg/glycosyltransferase, putative [Heliomicrobium modesticaldum Ice1]
MPVAFYFDAGPGVGLGHAMRSAALAEAFAERGYRVLAVGRRDGAVEALTKGLFLWRQPQGTGSLDAAPESWAAWLLAQGASILVVDSYRILPQTLGALRSAGLFVVYLDDKNSFPMDCQLVINAGLAASGERYRFLRPGRALLGPAYTPLRRAVTAVGLLREQKRRRGAIGQIVVTLGGGDPLGHLPRTLQALEQVAATGRLFEAHVIIGPYMDFPAAYGRVAWFRPYRPPADMATLLPTADLAVTAAGVTLQELLAAGVPAAVVIQADNQVPAALTVCRRQAAVPLFAVDRLDDRADTTGGNAGRTLLPAPLPVDEVARQLAALLDDPDRAQAAAERGRRLVDGQGARRCCDEILRDACAQVACGGSASD